MKRRVRRPAGGPGEALEERLLLAVTFRFDYTYDTNNFFDTQAKKDVLELAGRMLGSQFDDTLSAIQPSGGNTWRAIFNRPDTGTSVEVTDPTIAQNELLVYAGGRDLGSPVGNGGFGGYWVSGTSSFQNSVTRRGQSGVSSDTDFGPWGGQIAFNTTKTYHFGETVEGLGNGESDFFSVAVHELSHLLGFGIADSWDARISGGNFTGAESVAEYDQGGNVPLSGSGGHWASGTNDDGRETAMDPGIASGTRKLLTPLDWAGLVDIGWDKDLSLTQDFGDAPNSSYPTNLSSNGARHTLGSGLELGVTADPEADGQAGSNADGDDDDGFNDDDGVVFNDMLQAGTSVSVDVTATDIGFLDAWVDFNGDGDWADIGEQVFTSQLLTAGTNSLSISVPGSAAFGSTYARFRLSSTGALSYTGSAADGEVEDYKVEIVGEIAALDDDYTNTGTETLSVLDNDLPTNQGRILSFEQPASATVTRNFDGTLEFVADGGFSGTTTFDYVVAFKQDKAAGTDTDTRDEFGDAIDVSGDLAVVGVGGDDNANGADAGAVYIFERTDREWNQVTQILASDGTAADRFGFSVAIDGDTVVVGARQADVTGTNDGAAYIFQQNQGGTDNWGLVRKITGSMNSAKDHFGHSVAISGDTIVVGARLDDGSGTNSGSAYIFERDLGGTDNWGERKRIKATDAAGGDQFGFDVALDGNNLLIGARKDDDNGNDSGSVYFLNRDAGGTDNWGEFNKHLAPDGVKNDWFGSSVDLDGNYAIVGKPIRNNRLRPGKAYTYSKSGSTWGYVTNFGSVSGTDADQFGYSVSIDANTAAVGSRLEDSAAQNAGMVAVHSRNTGGTNAWGLDYELYSDDAAQGDYFGETVVIDGDWIAAGAPFDDDAGNKSGSVYFQETATTDVATVEVLVAAAGGGQGGGSGGSGGSGSGSGGGGSDNLESDDAGGDWFVANPTHTNTQYSAGDRCCCSQCTMLRRIVPDSQPESDADKSSSRYSLSDGELVELLSADRDLRSLDWIFARRDRLFSRVR